MWRVLYETFFGHVEDHRKFYRKNAEAEVGFDPDECNILLIGDIGVGKSSFVNAIMG